MFSKVLIANRGEIAVRIIRACEELGIATVAVYSDLDRDALHVRRADEAYILGPGPAAQSYLNIEKLLEVINQSDAEAVHPGYGFLAENATFAQALADSHGNVIHLGERDCSLQRRHQKLIEEAPAPAVDEELRQKIGAIATEAAAAVNYTGAGTIEGLLQDGEYFFLEMNTRVQVEHCVTEMTTGIDIVREGILAAAGEELSVKQEDVRLNGHAIECRINAEDASKNFAPAPGEITT